MVHVVAVPDENIDLFMFNYQQEGPTETSSATCNSRGSVFGCVGVA